MYGSPALVSTEIFFDKYSLNSTFRGLILSVKIGIP